MFFKEKGFYISLICGVLVLVAIGGIAMNISREDAGEKTVALESAKPVATAEPQVEESSTNNAKSEVKEETKKVKKKKKTVATNTEPVKNTLHFNQETGLLWPVKGDILMEYSPDNVIYHETLAQYRTNPAVIIEAKENTEVLASAAGQVTEITTSEETGRTLTMDIGDGFSVTFGQLKEIAVQKGDYVTEGQVIGKIAKPTKYYSVEGSNLYFQVTENGKTVNPMVLLR